MVIQPECLLLEDRDADIVYEKRTERKDTGRWKERKTDRQTEK